MSDYATPKPQTYNGDITKLPPALAHLRAEKVWLCWRWFWNGKKWTKPPYRADDPSRYASTSNPETWGTYEQALEQVRAGNADGIGFALKGRNIGGVDLDHCRDPSTGDIDAWAREYRERFPGAYTEITVSGRGLRVLGTSCLDSFAPKFKLPYNGNGAALELFSNSSHYLTLSCREISSCVVLPPIGDTMTALAAELRAPPKQDGMDFDAAPRIDDAPRTAPDDGTEEPEPGFTPWSFAEETRLRSALGAIPTDEKALAEKFGHAHDTWVKIGRAIERLDWGERGYAVFRDWSAQNAAEFDERGLRTQWSSFNRNRNAREKPTTVATVYHYAIKCGWRGDLPDEAVLGNSEDELPPLPFINMAKWDDEPAPAREWAVEDRIPLKQPYLFTGHGAVGKSLVELQRGCAHVLDRYWLGMRVKQGPVIYLGAEDDEDELHRRLADILAHYDAKFADIIGKLHLLSYAGDDCMLAEPNSRGIIRPTPLWGQIEEATLDIKPVAVMFDTLTDVYAGDEISRAQTTQFLKLAQKLAVRANCSMGVLAHPSNAGLSSGSGLSGSTGWHNKVRARSYMRALEAPKGDEPDPNRKEIQFLKNNYGKFGDTIQLRWQNGVYVLESAPNSLEKLAQDQSDDETFLRLLAEYEQSGRKTSETRSANNYAPRVFAGEKDKAGRKIPAMRLEQAMKRLFTARKIHVHEYGRPSRPYKCLALGPKPEKKE